VRRFFIVAADFAEVWGNFHEESNPNVKAMRAKSVDSMELILRFRFFLMVLGCRIYEY